MDELTWRIVAGQAVSLVALALCIAAFASKRDDRLLVLLISANVAFTLHFVLFESWAAAAITALIVLRILLARRFKGSWALAIALLAASFAATALTWQGALDLLPLTAAVLGTIGMVMLHGIAMRLFLAGAALAWATNNLAIGSIGGTIAEAVILATNVLTIVRLNHERRRGSVAAIQP